MKLLYRYVLSAIPIVMALYVIIDVIGVPGATPPSVHYLNEEFLIPFILSSLFIILLVLNLLLKRDNKFNTIALTLPPIFLFIVLLCLSYFMIFPPSDSEIGVGMGLLLILLGVIVFAVSPLLLIISIFKKPIKQPQLA
jgi:uncharacterized membrane protein YkvI